MRNRKNRMFIVGLLAIILVIAGAYALFATTLNIAGTATGRGDFKIEFSTFSVSDEEKATVTANSNNTSLTITADLSFPGDTATIYFTIKNTGGLSATVNDITINNNGNEDLNIDIIGLSAIQGTVLAVGETTSGSIVVTWNTASTNLEPDNADFDVTIDYLQST